MPDQGKKIVIPKLELQAAVIISTYEIKDCWNINQVFMRSNSKISTIINYILYKKWAYKIQHIHMDTRDIYIYIYI